MDLKKDQHGGRTRRTWQAGCKVRAETQNWEERWCSTNETLARRQPPKPASGTHRGGELHQEWRGTQALEIAGWTWQTTSTALPGSTRSQRAGAGAWVKVIPTATMLTSTDPVHARAVRIQWGLKLTSPGSTCKNHLNKQSRHRGKELQKVHRLSPRMREGCKELWPQPHLRLVCWTLKSCRDSVEAEQFISEYEPEMRVRAVVAAILDVGGHPTDYDVVVTSPFAKGRQLRTEEEVKGRRSNKPRTKISSTVGRRIAKHQCTLYLWLSTCTDVGEKSRQGAD